MTITPCKVKQSVSAVKYPIALLTPFRHFCLFVSPDAMVWRRGCYEPRGAPSRSAASSAATPPAAAAAAAAAAPPAAKAKEDKKAVAPKDAGRINEPAAGGAKAAESRVNFISNMIKDDLESGKHNSVLTRFPPSPTVGPPFSPLPLLPPLHPSNSLLPCVVAASRRLILCASSSQCSPPVPAPDFLL